MMLKSVRAVALAFAAMGLTTMIVDVAVAEIVPKPVLRPASPAAPVAPATQTAAKAVKPEAAAPAIAPITMTRGRVYVFRGLGNVFSRGMDQLVVKLKAVGVEAVILNHTKWHRLSDEIIAAYKADKNVAPIILIGHSLGADASLVMSNRLGLNGVPVRLIVAFDAVAETDPVMGTVSEVLNYYKPHGYGQEVRGAKSFKGTIVNVDLTERTDIDHLNIDKIEKLHEEVIVKVVAILKEKPKVAKAK